MEKACHVCGKILKRDKECKNPICIRCKMKRKGIKNMRLTSDIGERCRVCGRYVRNLETHKLYSHCAKMFKKQEELMYENKNRPS